ncbi:BrnT family toxin [Cyanothece sp. BG0011]|uniref:BrnT family toxin n=1 Tax=Cyanothece sp. BG0011 TaxID=2082950 RepID=UPI0018E56762|nr:BrnT family toxin [Cyanothece sp. BG0011]
MSIKFNGFDWEQGNEQKCQKHGLTKLEIEKFFQGKIRVNPDVKHSSSEDRYLAIGRSPNGKPMFVAFTLRNYQGET